MKPGKTFFRTFAFRMTGLKKLLTRIWIWCKRIRHLNGFGIQSPFAFSFVHTVIYRKLPRKTRNMLKVYRQTSPYDIRHPLPFRVEKLFYKLIQYSNPTFIIYIEKEFSGGIYSLTLNSRCPCFGYIENEPAYTDKERPSSDKIPQLTFGNIGSSIRERLKTHACIPFAYIDLKVKDASLLCELLLKRCRQDSLIILGNIHTDKGNEKLWKTLTKDKRTTLSFDLYTIGILMFDHHYYRQQYVINFEG